MLDELEKEREKEDQLHKLLRMKLIEMYRKLMYEQKTEKETQTVEKLYYEEEQLRQKEEQQKKEKNEKEQKEERKEKKEPGLVAQITKEGVDAYILSWGIKNGFFDKDTKRPYPFRALPYTHDTLVNTHGTKIQEDWINEEMPKLMEKTEKRIEEEKRGYLKDKLENAVHDTRLPEHLRMEMNQNIDKVGGMQKVNETEAGKILTDLDEHIKGELKEKHTQKKIKVRKHHSKEQSLNRTLERKKE